MANETKQWFYDDKKFWEAFKYAMSLGIPGFSMGAGAYAALGGSPTKAIGLLWKIVSSLRKFMQYTWTNRRFTASLGDWALWAAKNEPHVLQAAEWMLGKLAPTVAGGGVKGRVAGALVRLPNAVIAQQKNVLAGGAYVEGESVFAEAAIAWTIGWIVGSIGYGLLEHWDLNKSISGSFAPGWWADHYRNAAKRDAYGFFGWWYGAADTDQDTAAKTMQMRANRVIREYDLTLANAKQLGATIPAPVLRALSSKKAIAIRKAEDARNG